MRAKKGNALARFFIPRYDEGCLFVMSLEILSNLVFWESDLGGKFFYSVDETDTFDDVRYDL